MLKIKSKSSSMPGLIPDSRYNSPQKSSNSGAFHTPKSSKSANFHTPPQPQPRQQKPRNKKNILKKNFFAKSDDFSSSNDVKKKLKKNYFHNVSNSK
jgi:hypothetical protein